MNFPRVAGSSSTVFTINLVACYACAYWAKALFCAKNEIKVQRVQRVQRSQRSCQTCKTPGSERQNAGWL